MSKNIWHTKYEIPRQESRVVWKYGNVVCGGRFDSHYKCFCGPASQFVDLKRVRRWCYIDDLLSCEQELARTREALDKALYYLDAEYHAYIMVHKKEPELIAKVLAEIKDITKGGSNE